MNRRKFLKLGAIGAGVCVAGGLTTLLSTRPIAFEQAQRNPNLRDNYLEQILEQQEIPEYVASVTYKTPEQLFEETGETPPKTTNMFIHIRGKYIDIGTQTMRSDVYVLPHAFETNDTPNETDFINLLVDHEFFHAKTLYHGFGVIENSDLQAEQGKNKGLYDKRLFVCIYELLANENQEKQARKKPVSDANGLRILNNYMFEYFKLWDLEDEHPRVCKKLKTRFFKNWMKQGFKRDSKGTYILNEKTNKKYHLNFIKP